LVEYIYYTGIGAKKSGKHTVKEFLSIMNKTANIACSEYLPELDNKACREYKEMSKKAVAYIDKNNKLSFKVTRNNKKFKKLSRQCMKLVGTVRAMVCFRIALSLPSMLLARASFLDVLPQPLILLIIQVENVRVLLVTTTIPKLKHGLKFMIQLTKPSSIMRLALKR
jgi:hypothetical protein